MEARLDYRKFNQEPLQAMFALEKYLSACSLDHKLIHLLKLRASQINGCAYCIDMHAIDARVGGDTEQRLYGLDAWRETPFFTEKERAGLAYIEAVTRVAESHVSDEVWGETKTQFTDQEMIDLTWLGVVINAWNRLAISTRAVPGRYRAKATVA